MTILIVILSIVIFLLILYLLIGFILRYLFCSKKMISKYSSKSNENSQEDIEWFIKNQKKLSIVSFDNKILNAFIFENSSHLYIVYAHGWCGRPSDKTKVLKQLYSHYNANILLIEQRGQTNSPIKYCSMGSKEGKDLLFWANKIVSIDPSAKIIVYGQSMGASTVLYSMSYGLNSNVVGAIEDCGYLSIKKQYISAGSQYMPKLIAKMFVPALCFSLFLTGSTFIKHNPTLGIKKWSKKLLVFHGTEDELVPFDNALFIEKQFKKDKNITFSYFVGAKHISCFTNEPDKYIKVIYNFIDKLF